MAQNGRKTVIYKGTFVSNQSLIEWEEAGTSKLDWMYLEHNKIDRNKLQIGTNLQKGTGSKLAEKLNNVKKFERKRNQISALFSKYPETSW